MHSFTHLAPMVSAIDAFEGEIRSIGGVFGRTAGRLAAFPGVTRRQRRVSRARRISRAAA